MDNELKLFKNEELGMEVRCVLINEEPWIVGKDLVGSLGYNLKGKHVPSEYIKYHCDEEDYILVDKNSPLNDGGVINYKVLGQRGGYLVNESGMYSLVFGSDLPSAKQFKKWVTSEVLPTIRKTGGFVEDEREEEFINKYFTSFSEDVKKAMIDDLLKANKALKGKADCFDRFLDKDGTYNFQQTAKMISTIAKEEDLDITITSTKLTEFLRSHGVLCKDKKSKGGYKNLPRKEYEEYFNVTADTINGISVTQSRLKSTGIKFVYDMLKKDIA